LINKHHHVFNFMSIKTKEFFATINRHVNDYDVPSRVKSRMKKAGLTKDANNGKKSV